MNSLDLLDAEVDSNGDNPGTRLSKNMKKTSLDSDKDDFYSIGKEIIGNV